MPWCWKLFKVLITYNKIPFAKKIVLALIQGKLMIIEN